MLGVLQRTKALEQSSSQADKPAFKLYRIQEQSRCDFQRDIVFDNGYTREFLVEQPRTVAMSRECDLDGGSGCCWPVAANSYNPDHRGPDGTLIPLCEREYEDPW